MDRHLLLMRMPQQLPAVVLSAFWGAGAGTGTGRYGRPRRQLPRLPADPRDRHPHWRSAPTDAAFVRLLVARDLRLVLVGGALRLALVLAAAHLLGALLFAVDTLVLLTFVGVPLILAAALFAAYLPAAPAASRDVTALRTA